MKISSRWTSPTYNQYGPSSPKNEQDDTSNDDHPLNPDHVLKDNQHPEEVVDDPSKTKLTTNVITTSSDKTTVKDTSIVLPTFECNDITYKSSDSVSSLTNHSGTKRKHTSMKSDVVTKKHSKQGSRKPLVYFKRFVEIKIRQTKEDREESRAKDKAVIEEERKQRRSVSKALLKDSKLIQLELLKKNKLTRNF